VKALYLMDGNGSFRRAKSDQIAMVLDGRDRSRIASLTVDANGEAIPVALTAAEIEELRAGIESRRAAELADGLDHHLAGYRRLDSVAGIFINDITIYVHESPWAEAAVRDWAASRSLYVVEEPMPTKGDRWTRGVNVQLGPERWSRTIVSLTWPTVSLVEHDAKIDGRVIEAAPVEAEVVGF
jgi:hypothetical protein